VPRISKMLGGDRHERIQGPRNSRADNPVPDPDFVDQLAAQ
jgi:hypothetical protein